MKRDIYKILSVILLVIVLILIGILVHDHFNSDEPVWKSFAAPDTARVDTTNVHH